MKTRFAAALVLALAVSGCGHLPPTHYYMLEAGDAHRGSRIEGGPTVGVAAFHVDAPYDQDRIVYRVGEDSPEISFYAYRRWAAPLSRMVPRLAAATLDGAGGATVEPAEPGRAYGARLEGRIMTLEEVDLAAGQRVRARLVLTLRLADGSDLWSREVAGESELNTNRVGVVVQAMHALLEELIASTRAEVARALTRQAPPG
jgi:uncharacterized lipoprotein YmbA